MNTSTKSHIPLHPACQPGLSILWALPLCILLVSSTVSAQSLQSVQADGTPVVVTRAQDGLHLERGATEPELLPLAVGSVAHDLRQSSDGFLLAAVEPTDVGSRIAVLASRDGEVVRLPELPEPTGSLLREPTLLSNSQGLHGLLWLESDTPTSQKLYATRFDGESWQEVAVVAPRGPGSQMALTAAVLDDGSWLAAWAAFDGQDTEILWSRAVAGQWSKPRTVAQGNQVPDITPHLLAVPGGALLAWSRYDGNDYRVMVARFEGSEWQLPLVLGGAGTVYPRFQGGERPALVFQQAVPAAWEVIALTRDGRLLHRGIVESDREEAPLVQWIDSEGATLLWPEDQAKAVVEHQLSWTK